MERKPAVILLSGGLDSTTTLAIAQSEGFDAHAITFKYGQRHDVELQAAKRVAESMGVLQHRVSEIDLRSIGGSALTSDIEVPKDREIAEMDSGIPVTYVPARNTIFLSIALAWAEVLDAMDIFIGVNAVDYSGYPDCRPEYIAAYENMANLALKTTADSDAQLRIHTPLIQLTKSQIIARGLELGVDYGLSSTCYDPTVDGLSCGHCDACTLRLKGFEEAGVPDPIGYV